MTVAEVGHVGEQHALLATRRAAPTMTSFSSIDPPPVVGLLLALGIGLLIGLERERRKGAGPDRRAAGIRSFALVAVGGALAQLLSEPGLVAVGGLLVASLAAVSHFKSRSSDPGLTTELALFVTYLVGALVATQPLLGTACGVALALLMNTRTRLHRFATHALTEQELHDGLLLCAAALIVLPLIPDRPVAWLGEINPRPLAAIAVLILALQAVSHVAVRSLGPRLGLVAAGFFAGFASSTAAIASLGRQARTQPERAALLAAGAAWSTAATWVLAMLMAAALSIEAAFALAPVAVAGLGCTLAACAGLLARAPTDPMKDVGSTLGQGGAIRIREAIAMASMLFMITLLVSYSQRWFGQAGLMLSVALAGLADAHSSVASLGALFAAGRLPRADLILGVLLAITANSGTRLVVALAAGGWTSGCRVGAALASGLTGAWAAWAWWP